MSVSEDLEVVSGAYTCGRSCRQVNIEDGVGDGVEEGEI